MRNSFYNNNGRALFDPSDIGLLEMLLKKDTREGEEGLMLAVLGDAIEYFQKYLLAKDEKGKKLFREAEEWILEKNSDWFFSFENICEVLRLHPDYIRQGLLCWKEAALKRRSSIKISSQATRGRQGSPLRVPRDFSKGRPPRDERRN